LPCCTIEAPVIVAARALPGCASTSAARITSAVAARHILACASSRIAIVPASLTHSTFMVTV
jgi:hypothetical protein